MKSKPIETTTPPSTPEPITSRVSRVHEGIRGVSPYELSKYRNDIFICDLNKKKFNSNVINDGYCDCEDGTDEPGTSACSRGTFKCLNKGYKIIPITSSRVDDGICDCCDGSDEGGFSGVGAGTGVNTGVNTINCPNTCNEFAAKERATLDRIAVSYKQGVEVRNRYIDEASLSYSNAMTQTKYVETEQINVQTKLDALQIVLDREIELEKVEKVTSLSGLNIRIDDQLSLSSIHTSQLSNLLYVLCIYYDVTLKEIQQYVDNIMHIDSGVSRIVKNPKLHSIDVKKHADIDHSLYLTPIESNRCIELSNSNTILKYICNYVRLNIHTNTDTNTDTGKDIENTDKIENFDMDMNMDIDTTFTLIELSKYILKEIIRDKGAYVSTQYGLIGILTGRGLSMSTNSDTDTDSSGSGGSGNILFDTTDVLEYMKTHDGYSVQECLVEFPSESYLCSLSESLKGLYSSGYGAQYIYNRQETGLARSEVKKTNIELKSLKDKTVGYSKTVELYTKHSGFIPFVALNEQCMESGDGGKFIYTLCMLNDIKQKEVNGHSTVNLGSFESFEERSDGAIVMHFDLIQHTHCHAHGARRADVVVVCGVENSLKEPREPSTCFYTFELESPAACTHKYAELNGIA